MNEDVYKMIDTLHARLDDVRGAVESLHCEAVGYAEKLDKVDDKLYLLQCEIEKLNASSEQEEQSSDEQASEASNTQTESDQPEEAGQAKKESTDAEEQSEGDSKKKEIFSDDMKENLADAGRAIGNIYRDGKEVITELSGTMGDLKDIFSFGKKR